MQRVLVSRAVDLESTRYVSAILSGAQAVREVERGVARSFRDLVRHIHDSGVSYRKMAEIMGLDASYLCGVEAGQRSASHAAAERATRFWCEANPGLMAGGGGVDLESTD